MASTTLQILFEDNHLIAINKAASQIVQGDKTGDTTLPDLIKGYLKEKYQKPGNVFCGVIHRLDRPTSGIVLFARTSKALERMNAQFRDKETNKTYWAILEKEPTEKKATLTHYLKKNEKQNKSYVVGEKEGGKLAKLHYEIIGKSEHYFLAEVQLETGRHHQIRAQFAAIGCRIKGDLKYGAKRANPDGSIALHARKLSFFHPTTKENIVLTAQVPNDPLWTYFEHLF